MRSRITVHRILPEQAVGKNYRPMTTACIAGMAFLVVIVAPIPVTEQDGLVGISPRADLKPGTESIAT
jgi:hypothetical protein